LTEDLRDGFVNEAPKGFLTMYQAMRLLGSAICPYLEANEAIQAFRAITLVQSLI
jgi:hypothetical protein